jgi:hypothetical protein
VTLNPAAVQPLENVIGNILSHGHHRGLRLRHLSQSSTIVSELAGCCAAQLGLTELLEPENVEGPPAAPCEVVSLTPLLIVSDSFTAGTEKRRAEVVAPQQHPSPDIRTRAENWSYERKVPEELFKNPLVISRTGEMTDAARRIANFNANCRNLPEGDLPMRISKATPPTRKSAIAMNPAIKKRKAPAKMKELEERTNEADNDAPTTFTTQRAPINKKHGSLSFDSTGAALASLKKAISIQKKPVMN